MKRKVVISGILGSVLLLGAGCFLAYKNVDTKADTSKSDSVRYILEDVEAGECPEYFNILCNIKSKTVTYDEVKDKDLVLAYEVNSQFEGKEEMKMVVEEYEADGETPKTVHFEAEIVGREKAWIPYTIFIIEKDQIYDKCFDDVYSAPASCVFEEDIYKCGFADQEKASTFDSVVDLKSSELSPDDVEDVQYAALTYSINGGEEKTVYAHKETKIIPGTAIYREFNYEAQIFANKGDVIEYKVVIPTKDQSKVYEDVQKVEVK